MEMDAIAAATAAVGGELHRLRVHALLAPAREVHTSRTSTTSRTITSICVVLGPGIVWA